MASKPRTATRTSSRNKAQTASVPSATRVTRTASSAKTKDSNTKGTTSSSTKATGRKPFVSRDNSPELRQNAEKSSKSQGSALQTQMSLAVVDDLDREPVKAFLRIRPHLSEDEPAAKPYLESIADTAVRMVDPAAPSSSRLSNINPSSIYTFSRVFPPETTQPDFFTKTTLPLVIDVLNGQNSLLFAYGVTNSGKTYTIQGGGQEGSAGILPRSLDVIFNSIEGLHGDGRFQPTRLQGIERADEASYPLDPSSHFRTSSVPALADVLQNLSLLQPDTDTTTLKLDRNHEYTIWISYAEVYNEKVYDLLASVDDQATAQSPHPSGIPRPTSSYLNLPVPNSQSYPLLLTRKALSVKSCPPSDSDSTDTSSTGRYIAGLRQLRVHSAAQAKELLRLGQLHRTVFGTLANSQSSRSHAFVTIKVLRVHRGERNDPQSIQTSRLTLVDLAGSERTKHTQTTGDRLREAGNINNSLMVLGQCMETMRSNQRILARSLGSGVKSGSRLDTRDVKKGLAVVPFRHSKLTEILMDYFVNEGRVAMIVNVNPFDTGYDENSHVMKFAALAREVCVTAPTAIPRPVPIAKPKPSSKTKGVQPHTRKVTLSLGGSGKKMSEAHLEVLEEDEEPDEGNHDGDDDDDSINPLVNALFDEIEVLRLQLFEAEIRAAVIEAETREEVMQEMETRMQNMEKMYTRRLMTEVLQNEMKMDEKLDMLQSSGLLAKRSKLDSESEVEELADIDEEDESMRSDYNENDDASQSDLSRSPSPLAKKTRPGKTSSIKPIPRPRPCINDVNTEAEDQDSQDDDTSDGIEDWDSPLQAPRGGVIAKNNRNPTPVFEDDIGSSGVEDLEENMDALTLSQQSLGGRDSVVIIPNKQARHNAVAHGGPDVEYVPKPGEIDEVHKKRQLKKPAATDPNDNTLRRSTRRSRAGQ